MPRKKGTTGNYFTEETEKWIEKYLDEENEYLRNFIFTKYLHKPFKKISEVYYNTLSVPYIEGDKNDIINDCIAHLITTTINGIKKNRGKAYSYLSVSAKYYYIQLNAKYYTQYKNKQSLTSNYDESEDIIDSNVEVDYHNNEIKNLYYNFREYLKEFADNSNINKTLRLHMYNVIDYMDNFDFDDLKINKFINNRFSEKYKISRNNLGRFKPLLHNLWVDYKDYYIRTGTYMKYKKSSVKINPIDYTIS